MSGIIKSEKALIGLIDQIHEAKFYDDFKEKPLNLKDYKEITRKIFDQLGWVKR
jgi:hypothetical protein